MDALPFFLPTLFVFLLLGLAIVMTKLENRKVKKRLGEKLVKGILTQGEVQLMNELLTKLDNHDTIDGWFSPKEVKAIYQQLKGRK